ncbi:AAA family ATPase [Paracoccus sp. KR1-242]|uniref:AAA family ATPase n=1 Tax=Paracoccus sp. KR1-242 TaxID=3410028 RepID=UPI003C0BF12D
MNAVPDYARIFADIQASGVAPPPARLAAVDGRIIIDSLAPRPTPFVWRDPSSIPPRPWVYGNHLQRLMCSVTVSPGGVGKTTLAIMELLCMATGREILGAAVPEALTVWGLFLEEPRDELERRVAASMLHHNINPDELAGRFYIDGNDSQLCLATQGRDGIQIVEPVSEKLIEHIREHGIDHLTVDPFVKSHRVGENDNSAIDAVATEWARIARECNISVELVHHTRKGNGATLTSEDGRGGSALLNAARDGRVLNRASHEQRQKMGVNTATDHATYFSVTQDKTNMSTGSGASWYRTVGVAIGNGDWVATVEPFEVPDTFDGITVKDTLLVQRAIDELPEPRASEQSGDWVGNAVANVLGLPLPESKARVKALISEWLAKDVLRTENRKTKGQDRPYIIVGEWITDI